MEINKTILQNKKALLNYFRNRSREILNELTKEYGRANYKKITQKLQPALKSSRDNFIRVALQKAEKEKWSKEDILSGLLMLHHTCNVLIIDSRHSVWPYEYMTLSRRVGELWESFISVCFHHPVADDLEIVVPPLFSDVRDSLHEEVISFIKELKLTNQQKTDLIKYYGKVWMLVDAGEIKLELDMHCKKQNINYNIDFKSGFSSNEKGNTNRLLVVASIYKNIIDSPFQNLMMVRSSEDENNHYLQTLKRSDLWDVTCSDETYVSLGNIVGFNLKNWIEINIDWENDLNKATIDDFSRDDLLKYFKW